MEWMLVTDNGGPAIERARRKPLHYSFTLTTENYDIRFLYLIARSTLDDYYLTELEEDTLLKANSSGEVARFKDMAIKMKGLGFRSSIEGKGYLITASQFQRFF